MQHDEVVDVQPQSANPLRQDLPQLQNERTSEAVGTCCLACSETFGECCSHCGEDIIQALMMLCCCCFWCNQ
ncbi:hypothetical protein L596_020073 [Steinernema carpocapsae]|uniref:Uncharacterized protein n=1 Tax=Steinernema carpocapsae TaxID=34508 RepID=A0A4U5MSI6_STECR|nr:hypothetical protein L596_020073 [Steinernema carpocapsae]